MEKQNFYDLNFDQLKSFLIEKGKVEPKKAKMRSQQLFNAIYKKNIKNGGVKFIKKAVPLTVITAILFIIAIYFLTNYYVLDEAILKVIFIGLASLTFPHILLEYLIEKNEK